MNVVARPRSLFTFVFDCFDEEEQIIATIQHRAFRSRGSIVADGVEFSVKRAGVGLEVRPALDTDSGRHAEVTINARGRGQMTVEWGRQKLGLARAGIGFRMLLISKGRPVGKLGLRDLFGRTMILESDVELPATVVGALFWLAVARRRQLLMIGS